MKVIIDRFENEFAVIEIEKNKFINVPKILFPNAQEGDVIKIEIDKEETNKRKEEIQKIVNNLFED